MGFFRGLCAMPIMSSSHRNKARLMTSKCPDEGGSKEPAYRAIFFTGYFGTPYSVLNILIAIGFGLNILIQNKMTF